MLTFTVTEVLADKIFWWSNFALIVGAIAILIGTIGSIAASSAKEQFVSERLSNNETEIARANESAANANERAAKSELDLARIKAPRDLSAAQIESLRTELAPFKGTTFEISTYPGDSETASLASKIASTLESAGWVRIPTDSQPLGLVSGVFVALNAVTSFTPAGEAVRTPNPVEENIAGHLIEALRVAGITAGFAGRNSLRVNPQRVVLQVIVGKKP